MLILIISVAFILALIFIPILRRIIGVLLTIGISLLAIGSAVFGFAVLMNNVSINERPGMHARIRRFLTVNWAATSDKGLGSVTCEQTEKSAGEVVEAAAEKTTEPKGRRKEAKLAATPTPTPSATATPEAGAEEEIYPELVQRGYPGIPRPTLFKLAEATVNEQAGWKIVKSDPKDFTLDCIYTTRLFHWNDDVKIVVTPRGEIHLCSHSNAGKGDFGANIAHVKEFYTAVEPKIDQAYKEEEKKQNAQPPKR